MSASDAPEPVGYPDVDARVEAGLADVLAALGTVDDDAALARVRARAMTLPADVLTGPEQASLPPGCRCGYALSRADGLWRVISRARCPMHAAAARDRRLRELAAMPKRDLIAIYRPRCLWSATPLDKWSKDDLIASVLAAEYPTAADAAAESEAWGGRGPSESYAAWVNEGREP